MQKEQKSIQISAKDIRTYSRKHIQEVVNADRGNTKSTTIVHALKINTNRNSPEEQTSSTILLIDFEDEANIIPKNEQKISSSLNQMETEAKLLDSSEFYDCVSGSEELTKADNEEYITDGNKTNDEREKDVSGSRSDTELEVLGIFDIPDTQKFSRRRRRHKSSPRILILRNTEARLRSHKERTHLKPSQRTSAASILKPTMTFDIPSDGSMPVAIN